MLKIIKLYSDEGHFQPISFTTGINLISGEKSTDSSGQVTSQKQNSVGKSLSVELINFCLLKKEAESRIFTDIPEESLPLSSFVNLHFQFNNKDYIFSRNRKNEVKIKKGDGLFINFEFEDAKQELNQILNFDQKEISAREYLMFAIKEEDYSYKEFVKLYKSSYTDLLKIHFYFFNLPTDILKNIKISFDEYDNAIEALKKINKELDSKDLDIETLRAKKNEYELQVQNMENQLDYSTMVSNIDKESLGINKLEIELSNLISKKKQLELNLLEINDFSNIFNEEFYIDDNDVELIFNKYKEGLGQIIKKDLDELKKFRDQIINFKNQLFAEKRDALKNEILQINKRISTIKEEINQKYGALIKTSSNTLVKNFRIYKTRTDEFENYSRYIKNYEAEEQVKKDARSKFNKRIDNLDAYLKKIENEVDSFKKTFVQIHFDVMQSTVSDFNITTTNLFQKEKFFQFNVYVEGQGGKGTNQIRAIIYDLALFVNSFTSPKNLGMLIHDNLIFGSVDKDSSIRILNYLNRLDQDSYQYIATVNADDYSYAELNKLFEFNAKEKVRIQLTKDKPIFYKSFKQKVNLIDKEEETP